MTFTSWFFNMAVGQNLVPLVNIKIAGKWMFIPLKMVLTGIDPYPFETHRVSWFAKPRPKEGALSAAGLPSRVVKGEELQDRCELNRWVSCFNGDLTNKNSGII